MKAGQERNVPVFAVGIWRVRPESAQRIALATGRSGSYSRQDCPSGSADSAHRAVLKPGY